MRLRSVALAAAGVGLGYGLERAVLRRQRRRVDAAAVAAFHLPEDATHREVPTSDGARLHVVERGSGRPLVLLHGITLSARAWSHQLLDLAPHFRVLAVDHRGHGDSVPGGDDWGLERLALDVVELLETLDLRDAVLVGHSMGGMVALRLAVDRPEVLSERVAALVLMSTAGAPLVRLAVWDALLRVVSAPARRGIRRLAATAPGGLFPESDLSYLLFRLGQGTGATPTDVEISRTLTAATPVEAWTELLPDVVRFDVLDRLADVTLPALVLVGTRDVLTPPSEGRRLADALAKAELEVYQGAGHMLMLERRDEIARRILRFTSERA